MNIKNVFRQHILFKGTQACYTTKILILSASKFFVVFIVLAFCIVLQKIYCHFPLKFAFQLLEHSSLLLARAAILVIHRILHVIQNIISQFTAMHAALWQLWAKRAFKIFLQKVLRQPKGQQTFILVLI